MTILSDNQVTIYEEPVVERVRKFIRMESLFHKLFFFKDRDNPMESYVALQSLCEIYEILTRSDIKSELIREIENQNKMFKKIQDIPNKTVTVMVERKYSHPVLKKVIKVRKNYNAHDENNKFKTGDKVSIIESKPFSKNKKFQVMESAN